MIYLVKPYQYNLMNKFDLISNIMILISVLFLFIMEVNEGNGCLFCGDKENTLCYMVIVPFSIGLLIHNIGILILLIK